MRSKFLSHINFPTVTGVSSRLRNDNSVAPNKTEGPAMKRIENKHNQLKRLFSVTAMMIAGSLFALFLASQSGCRAAQAEEALKKLAAAGNALVLKKHTVQDPGSGNMDSHTILAPRGWKVEGSAWWAHSKYFRILPSQDIKITSPDGAQVHVGPSLGFSDCRIPRSLVALGTRLPREMDSDGGYPVLSRPDNLRAWKKRFAEKIIPQSHPQASDIDVRNVAVIPSLGRTLDRMMSSYRQQVAQTNSLSQMYGGGVHSDIETVGLAVECEFTEGGKRWEKMFVMGIVSFVTQTNGIVDIKWSVEPNISYMAPRGMLESTMPALVAVATSIQPTPQWMDMKFKHIRKMGDIDRKGFEERSRIMSKSFAEIRKIEREGRREREAIRDETQRKFVNAIRGVSDYEHQGVEYQLPSGYDFAYTNGDDVILTNDALFQPNVDLQDNLEWSSLNLVR